MTIKINRINGLYVARCTFEERLVLKRQGFKFIEGKWVTSDDDVARKFYENCVDSARERLDNLKIIKQQLIEASYATDYDDVLLVPEGLSYLPFQRAGIAFALERDDTLIADQPGLGKTIQALGVINNASKVKNVLLIVPASLKLNWEKEAIKWIRPELGLTIGIAHTKPKIIIDSEGTKKSTTEYIWPEDDNVVIINYDMLEKFRDKIHSKTWDILVCDEAHVLKNEKAGKTKQVLGYQGKKKSDRLAPIPALKRIFLTGTPILNKPLDMWVMISSFGHENVFGNYIKFVKKFCAAFETPWGWDTSGTDNLTEFQELLRTTFMIRRLKDDVLKELPPKRRQIVTLPNDGLSKLVKKEKQIFADNLKALMIMSGEKTEEDYQEITDKELRKLIDNIHERTKNFSEEDDYDDYEASHFEAMSQAREEIGLAKLSMMIEYVRNLLDSGEKVVFLCVHRAVAHKVAAAFEDISVKFIGGMSNKEKNESVERFQNDDNCRLFIGNINAAGVGITLTEAWNLVMGELCFVPALLEQGEDRIHRIGQKAHALIHYLIVSGSLEERLMEIVLEKLKMIKEALDRKPS